MKSFTSLFISFVIFTPLVDAILDPPCSPPHGKPACTYDKRLVTDTLPICVRPIEEFDQCRGIPGMRKDPTVPKWFDHNWARRGQEITSEYRLPFYYNMFNGLLIETVMPDVFHPLLFNKKNSNGMDNAKRVMSTVNQLMLWTTDFLVKMPQEGQSNWIQSIKSVWNVHKDVQARGYDRVGTKGCLIDTTDYDSVETDDEAWDAFEADMAESKLLQGRRQAPTSSWLTCPDVTNCSKCATCECGNDGKDCTHCLDCSPCAGKTDNCYTARPTTYNCENCHTCHDGEKGCQNCRTCTNYERCLNFTVPLYNQQALGFVVYNLVGFPIMWSTELGIHACDEDLWAFNHLFAGILSMLGVEDDCNILLHPDIGQARVFYRAVFDNYILPTMFKFNKPTRFMMDNALKGLTILTGTTRLFLCRFLRDFVRIEAKQMCGILDEMDTLIDSVMNTMMVPEFTNDSSYRDLLNHGLDNKFQGDSERFFPNGECENFQRVSKECFA